MKIFSLIILMKIVLISSSFLTSCSKTSNDATIYVMENHSSHELLAAKEIRRYLYLRTDKLFPIKVLDTKKKVRLPNAIVVCTNVSPIVDTLIVRGLVAKVQELNKSDYWIKTVKSNDEKSIVISGETSISVLYAAYKFIESYGIRYTLNGDIIPDEKIKMFLPELDIQMNKRFEIRGMLPYHSWNPEGPENWNADAYKSFLTQQAKMGMNFMGLIYEFPKSDRRTYMFPPEEQRWTTGDYWIDTPIFGAHLAMKDNLYGSDRWREARKLKSEKEQDEYMNRENLKFIGDVFAYAKSLGVKTAIGAEFHADKQFFVNLFNDLDRAVKPDFFWISSPETWSYSSPAKNTIDNLLNTYDAAISAHKETKSPFKMATMGWSLGPQNDPLLLDRNLPKDVIISTQNLFVGKLPVDSNFAKITNRRKWVIPWMEDDFNLLSPQLWVKRTIENATDAQKYGAEGFIGVHWRTKTLTPQMMALAALGWNDKLNARIFYDDFALTHFGKEAATEISAIFQSIDGQVPEVSQWLDMWPGGIKKDSTYWSLHKEKFAFVDELEALRYRIKGVGNLDRFDYYLNQYKYLRAMAKFRSAIDKNDHIKYLRETMTYLIQSASTVGEIGNMICITRQFGSVGDKTYTGVPRLIVLTPRSNINSNEDLKLDVFFVEKGNPKDVVLYWKKIGEKKYKAVKGRRHKNNHYTIEVSAKEIGGNDIEYYIQGKTSNGQAIVFPATAKSINQTVIQNN